MEVQEQTIKPTARLTQLHGLANAAEPKLPVTVIEAAEGFASLQLHDLWKFRELVYFLIWRDIKVRYKQTALGVTWAVLQPLLTMIVFSVFFGRLAKVPSDGIPYPLFAYPPWCPERFCLWASMASNSLVDSSNLIRKVYFPRLAIPVATVLSGIVDFSIAFLMLLGMMLYYGHVPTVNVLWLPALLLLALTTSLGISLWLSTLNVQYRDVRYAIPFIAQIWMYATPIAYPSSLLPEPWRAVYALNPMVGVIEGFRWALLGANTRPGPMLAVSCVASLLILVSGAFYFRRMEQTFADVI